MNPANKTPIRDMGFEYKARNGTRFRAERTDLSHGIGFVMAVGCALSSFAQDTTEMIGWHRSTIFPQLNISETVYAHVTFNNQNNKTIEAMEKEAKVSTTERGNAFMPDKSSTLEAIAYDDKTKIMVVTFRGGGKYQYLDVPPNHFDGIRSAESAGKYHARYIKGGGFRCIRLFE